MTGCRHRTSRWRGKEGPCLGSVVTKYEGASLGEGKGKGKGKGKEKGERERGKERNRRAEGGNRGDTAVDRDI